MWWPRYSTQAAICAKKLVNEGVKAVIGSYTSGATEAAQTTYFRAGVLQTSDGTSDSLIAHKYWTFFRNSFPNSAEAANHRALINELEDLQPVIDTPPSSRAEGTFDESESQPAKKWKAKTI